MLVLSLFPGADLFGMAFEAEGFSVVQGPDVIFGRDIRNFHPPAGRFDGVIGGPPCQAFSRLRHLVEHNGHAVAKNLIPEFERVVAEAAPTWFVMENVLAAPIPRVDGYALDTMLLNNRWLGEEQHRLRRFTFGSLESGRSPWPLVRRAIRLRPSSTKRLRRLGDGPAAPAACASGGSRNGKSTKARDLGYKNAQVAADLIRLQGLPADFLEGAHFTLVGKIKLIGNGVPLPMGRVIATAVRRAVGARLNEVP